MVGRGKRWRGTREAQGEFPVERRRRAVAVRDERIALAIHEFHGEIRLDGGLVRVGSRAGNVVQREASEELRFCGDPMIDAHGELIGVGRHLGRCRVGARAVRALRIVGKRIARQQFGNSRIDGDDQGVAGESRGVVPGAFGDGRNGEHLRGSQHLPESLEFEKVEGAIAPVVKARQEHRPSVGKAELVADKWRNAVGAGERAVIEKIAGVQVGVAQEFEDRSVRRVGAGTGDDVGKPRGAAADLGGQPAGTRTNLLHGIDIEIGEGRAAHFGIARIGAVHGKDCGGAALSVDGELLREIGGAVGVGHGAGRQQEQLAEVAFIERQLGNRFAGKLLATGAGLRGGGWHNR